MNEVNNIKYHTINTTKYKTNLINIRFCLPVNNKYVADLLVLSELMTLSTKNFNTMKALNDHQSYLYDMKVNANLTQKGLQLIFELNFNYINKNFLPVNIDNEAIDLIAEVITNLNLNEDYILNIKNKCIQDIDSIYDEKMKFAFIQMINNLDPNEEVLLNLNSTKEKVLAVNKSSITNAYDYLINSSNLHVLISSSNANELFDIMSKKLMVNVSKLEINYFNKFLNTSDNKFICEKQDLNQSKFVVGVKLDLDEDDFASFQVFNAIYGGFAFSRLFSNIREKKSLAYTVASSYNPGVNLMTIYGGISNKDGDDYNVVAEVIEALNYELESIKSGEISDLEMIQANMMIENGLKSSLDSQQGHLDAIFSFTLMGKEFDYDLHISKINAVTKDDVAKIASNVKFNLIYLLRGEN